MLQIKTRMTCDAALHEGAIALPVREIVRATLDELLIGYKV